MNVRALLLAVVRGWCVVRGGLALGRMLQFLAAVGLHAGANSELRYEAVARGLAAIAVYAVMLAFASRTTRAVPRTGTPRPPLTPTRGVEILVAHVALGYAAAGILYRALNALLLVWFPLDPAPTVDVDLGWGDLPPGWVDVPLYLGPAIYLVVGMIAAVGVTRLRSFGSRWLLATPSARPADSTS